MILVILLVSLILFATGWVMIDKYYNEGLGGFFITCCLCCEVSSLAVIDEKIAMYQEENTKIEEQIADVVESYQQYETEIFTEVAPDSSIALVALYPELKSDTLVQSQIDVYIKNNEKIKSLKESKIGGSVSKWWLYFGS